MEAKLSRSDVFSHQAKPTFIAYSDTASNLVPDLTPGPGRASGRSKARSNAGRGLGMQLFGSPPGPGASSRPGGREPAPGGQESAPGPGAGSWAVGGGSEGRRRSPTGLGGAQGQLQGPVPGGGSTVVCFVCYAMLCYALPCYALLCSALPCYALLCLVHLRGGTCERSRNVKPRRPRPQVRCAGSPGRTRANPDEPGRTRRFTA